MKLALRIVALEDRTPIQAVPMDPAEVRALWNAMEAEISDADLSCFGITAHRAWAKYREMLNG